MELKSQTTLNYPANLEGSAHETAGFIPPFLVEEVFKPPWLVFVGCSGGPLISTTPKDLATIWKLRNV